MIDSVLNLLFRCPHRRLTRPVTPVGRRGKPEGGTYVVCLDCGKQFAYDVREMRIGKPIDHPEGVLAPDMPGPRRTKLKLAMWAVPLSLAVGGVVHWKRKIAPGKPQDAKDPGQPGSAKATR